MNANAPPLAPHLLLVEDHPLFRQGLAQLIQSWWPSARCTHAGSAAEALAALQAPADDNAIDWMFSDLKLPDRDGWRLVAEVRQRWPRVGCVLVSGSEDARAAAQARSLGCRGFIAKALEPEALHAALRAVLAGGEHFEVAASAVPPALSLTPRQQAVLQRLALGRTSRAIAKELGIAERTVKDHLAVLYGRLDASTRAEAVARAAALGLLDPLADVR